MTGFVSLLLLKCKAEDPIADVPPPSIDHPMLQLLTSPCKWHCPELVVLTQLRGFMRAGSWWLDALHMSKMATQEALGVMAVVMLWQQGLMQVAVWEMEMEDTLWNLVRMIPEEEAKDL